MTKWYNRPIEVVTKRNVIAVILFFNSLFFYVIQKISDSGTAKNIAIFSFSMGVGEYVGEQLGFKSKKDPYTFFIILILIVSLVFLPNLISLILAGIALGEKVGFYSGRTRSKSFSYS